MEYSDINSNTDKEAKKTAMKTLRNARKDLITEAASMMKNQKKQIQAIINFLTDRAATIPQIAQGIQMPSDQTLWYIATLKKYGRIVEGKKQGAFFTYALNEPEQIQKKEEV